MVKRCKIDVKWNINEISTYEFDVMILCALFNMFILAVLVNILIFTEIFKFKQWHRVTRWDFIYSIVHKNTPLSTLTSFILRKVDLPLFGGINGNVSVCSQQQISVVRKTEIISNRLWYLVVDTQNVDWLNVMCCIDWCFKLNVCYGCVFVTCWWCKKISTRYACNYIKLSWLSLWKKSL